MKIYTVIILAALTACGGNKTEEERKDGFTQTATNPEDSLFKAVMDEHDIAMPKMKKLAVARVRIDSLAKTKPKNERKDYESISGDLKNAEDHMNEWMNQFSIDTLQDNTQRRIEYLSSEKVKASKVKDEVLSSLAKADSVLKK
jgi:hypothetical protein